MSDECVALSSGDAGAREQQLIERQTTSAPALT